MTRAEIIEARRSHLGQMAVLHLGTRRAHNALLPRVFSAETTEADARRYLASFLKPWNPLKRRSMFADAIVEAETLQGYVLYIRQEVARDVMFWGGLVYTIWDIAVDARLRGRGLGRRLLGHVTDTARADGADRVTATVWAGNDPSRALFEGTGFAVQHRVMTLEMPSVYETDDA